MDQATFHRTEFSLSLEVYEQHPPFLRLDLVVLTQPLPTSGIDSARLDDVVGLVPMLDLPGTHIALAHIYDPIGLVHQHIDTAPPGRDLPMLGESLDLYGTVNAEEHLQLLDGV